MLAREKEQTIRNIQKKKEEEARLAALDSQPTRAQLGASMPPPPAPSLVPPAAADYNQAPHETQMLGSRMNQVSISVLRVLPLPHVTRSYLARHNCSFVAS